MAYRSDEEAALVRSLSIQREERRLREVRIGLAELRREVSAREAVLFDLQRRIEVVSRSPVPMSLALFAGAIGFLVYLVVGTW